MKIAKLREFSHSQHSQISPACGSRKIQTRQALGFLLSGCWQLGRERLNNTKQRKSRGRYNMIHSTGTTDQCTALCCCWWYMVSQACILLAHRLLCGVCSILQFSNPSVFSSGCRLWFISSLLHAFSAGAKRVTAPVSPHCLLWRNHETHFVKVHSLTFYYSVSQNIRKVNLVTGYCSGCWFETPSRPFLRKVRLHWLFLGHTASFVCVCWVAEKELLAPWTHGGPGQDNANPVCKTRRGPQRAHTCTDARTRAAVLEWATCCGAACWSSASTQKSQLNKTLSLQRLLLTYIPPAASCRCSQFMRGSVF